MKAVKCAAGFALAGSLLAVCPALAFADEVQMGGEDANMPPQGYVPDPEPQIDTEPPLPLEPPHIGGAISAISEETTEIDDHTILTEVSQAGSFESLAEATAFIESGESKYDSDKQSKPESEFSDFNQSITERSFEADLGHWPYDADKAYFDTEEEAQLVLDGLAIYGYTPEDCVIERHLVGEIQNTRKAVFKTEAEANDFFEVQENGVSVREIVGDAPSFNISKESVKSFSWSKNYMTSEVIPNSKDADFFVIADGWQWTYWSPSKISLTNDIKSQLLNEFPKLKNLKYVDMRVSDYAPAAAIFYESDTGDYCPFLIFAIEEPDYTLKRNSVYFAQVVYYGDFANEYEVLYEVTYNEMVPQYQYSLEGNMQRMITMFEANYDYSYITTYLLPPGLIEIPTSEDVGGNPRKIVDDDVPINSPEAYASEPEVDLGEPVNEAKMSEEAGAGTDNAANYTSEYAKAEVLESSNSQLLPATIDSIPTRVLAMLVGVVSILLALISPKRNTDF